MGYYTGAGVVTSGGSSISTMDTVISGGTLIRQQKHTSSIRVFAGVSLATAQGYTPTSTLKCGDITCDNYYWASPNAYQYFKNYGYSRISDSNLYSLTETEDTLQLRLCARSGAGELSYGSWAS